MQDDQLTVLQLENARLISLLESHGMCVPYISPNVQVLGDLLAAVSDKLKGVCEELLATPDELDADEKRADSFPPCDEQVRISRHRDR